MKKGFLGVIGALLATGALAATSHQICKPELYVYFSNGIQNDWPTAFKSREHLELFVLPAALPKQAVKVDSLYHGKDSFQNDTSEVFVQKTNEAKYKDKPFAQKVRAWYGLPNIGGSSLDQFFSDWKSHIVNASAERLAKNRLPEANQRVAQEAQRDVAKIMARLAAGSKILIVSHSQGNLYTNIAYESLMASPYKDEAKERVVLAAFGSAAAITYQNGAASTAKDLYVTADNDRVISLLRQKAKWTTENDEPLVPNVTAASSQDNLNHGFIETYTNKADQGMYDRALQLIARQAAILLNKPAAQTIAFGQEFRADLSGYDLRELEFPPAQETVNPQNGKIAARTTTHLVASTLVSRTTYYCAGLTPSTLALVGMYSPEIPPRSFKSLTLVNGALLEKQLPISGRINGYGLVEVPAGTVKIAGDPVKMTALFE